MRAVLLAAVIFAQSAALLWAESVGRYGVSANIPDRFVMGARPGNDDGRTFTDDYGATVRLWGSWRIEDLHADENAMREYYKNVGSRISYEARGTGWYVMSGYLGQSIFYLRVEDGRTCSGEPARAAIELLYPADAREFYDPLVGGITRSLGFGPC